MIFNSQESSQDEGGGQNFKLNLRYSQKIGHQTDPTNSWQKDRSDHNNLWEFTESEAEDELGLPLTSFRERLRAARSTTETTNGFRHSNLLNSTLPSTTQIPPVAAKLPPPLAPLSNTQRSGFSPQPLSFKFSLASKEQQEQQEQQQEERQEKHSAGDSGAAPSSPPSVDIHLDHFSGGNFHPSSPENISLDSQSSPPPTFQAPAANPLTTIANSLTMVGNSSTTVGNSSTTVANSSTTVGSKATQLREAYFGRQSHMKVNLAQEQQKKGGFTGKKAETSVWGVSTAPPLSPQPDTNTKTSHRDRFVINSSSKGTQQSQSQKQSQTDPSGWQTKRASAKAMFIPPQHLFKPTGLTPPKRTSEKKQNEKKKSTPDNNVVINDLPEDDIEWDSQEWTTPRRTSDPRPLPAPLEDLLEEEVISRAETGERFSKNRDEDEIEEERSQEEYLPMLPTNSPTRSQIIEESDEIISDDERAEIILHDERGERFTKNRDEDEIEEERSQEEYLPMFPTNTPTRSQISAKRWCPAPNTNTTEEDDIIEESGASPMPSRLVPREDDEENNSEVQEELVTLPASLPRPSLPLDPHRIQLRAKPATSDESNWASTAAAFSGNLRNEFGSSLKNRNIITQYSPDSKKSPKKIIKGGLTDQLNLLLQRKRSELNYQVSASNNTSTNGTSPVFNPKTFLVIQLLVLECFWVSGVPFAFCKTMQINPAIFDHLDKFEKNNENNRPKVHLLQKNPTSLHVCFPAKQFRDLAIQPGLCLSLPFAWWADCALDMLVLPASCYVQIHSDQWAEPGQTQQYLQQEKTRRRHEKGYGAPVTNVPLGLSVMQSKDVTAASATKPSRFFADFEQIAQHQGVEFACSSFLASKLSLAISQAEIH